MARGEKQMHELFWCKICKRMERFTQHADFPKKWVHGICGYRTSNPKSAPPTQNEAFKEIYEKALRRSNLIMPLRSR